MDENKETQLEFYDAEEDLEEMQQNTTFDITELNDALKKASEGAITIKTRSNYQRYQVIIILTLRISIYSSYFIIRVLMS